jgi:5-methylcytosine-specific restriction protein B
LYPNYEVLQKYHAATGFDAKGLISVLGRLNDTINDKHYFVGISFFLLGDIESKVQNIWQMEIEPYVEELFFDQPEKATSFSWERVKGEILG